MSKTPRTPADYAEILGGEELPLIVGGQAVNLWAELYTNQSSTLAELAPFTSADADIYGSRMLAETLARRNGWECRFPNEANSIVAALLIKPGTAEGETALTIEVLNEVNGLSEADLNLNSVVELADGARYRIPSPLVLLKAKLYNLVSLANLDRPQDLRHARMLFQIVPLYLNELHSEFRAGRLDEATLLGAARYAGSVITAPFAGNAGRSHSLDLGAIFPMSLRTQAPDNVRNAVHDICTNVAKMQGRR